MAIRSLDKTQCKNYFERISRELSASSAQIEVAGLAIGDQIESDWSTLRGLSYDPRDDRLDVLLDALDHRIDQPREVYVDDGADGLHSVQVVDADGNRQIIRLREALRLPRGEL